MWRSPTVRSSSARWSRPYEAEPAADLAASDGGAVLRGGGLLLLLLVLVNVLRLSTPPVGEGRLCCWSLKLIADCRHACMRITVCVAQCCCRDGNGSPFDSQTRTFGCAQHDSSRWRFVYARMRHCASVVLSRKCGLSCLACAVCQCLHALIVVGDR